MDKILPGLRNSQSNNNYVNISWGTTHFVGESIIQMVDSACAGISPLSKRIRVHRCDENRKNESF